MTGEERAEVNVRHREGAPPRGTIERMETPSTIEQEVRRFVAENFSLSDDSDDLDARASLTRTGLLDSMGVLELIMFLEARFDVSISNEEALPENLDSVERIVSFVGDKLGAA